MQVKTFKVELMRPHGTILGINVDQQTEGQALPVSGIMEGVVMKWNNDNPSHAIQPGDKIIAVDDVEGTALQLVAACQKTGLLILTIERELLKREITPFDE